jgi:hypothetical protein
MAVSYNNEEKVEEAHSPIDEDLLREFEDGGNKN